jgi:hypothetical protein
MAGNSTKLSQMQQKTYADPSDMLVAYSQVSNADVLISVSNIFSSFSLNSNGLTTSNLTVTNNHTPANSSVNVSQGSIWYDTNYLYVAVANNIIKRITLTSF